MMALRWKKDPAPTGLYRVVAGPRSSTLRDGDEKFASVHASRTNYKTDGWYWVARNDAAGVPLTNTCDDIVADEATAKANAMAFVKACIKKSAAPATPAQGQTK